jgi:hypothetical protein
VLTWQPKREERATTGSSVTWHVLGLRMGDQGGGGGWIRGATHLGAPCFLSCSLSCSLSRNPSSASCCLRRIRRRRRSQPNLLGLARVSIRGTGKTGHLPGRYAVGGSGGGGGVTGGGWWWWKQERTRGNIWSRAARFGEHAPGGHKRPLLPVPINAIMAQSAKALRTDLTCVRISCVLFFFCHILLLLLSNY